MNRFTEAPTAKLRKLVFHLVQTVLRSLDGLSACSQRLCVQRHSGSLLSAGDRGRAPKMRSDAVLGCMQLAIYSEADRLQPHRYKADESYEVGEPLG